MEKGCCQCKQKKDGIFRMALAPKKFFSSNLANELSSQGRPSTKTYPQSKSTKTCYEPGDDLLTRIEKTSETF